MDLVTGILVEALASFGGKEEILAMTRHPRADTQLGSPIARCDVDMIHAVFEQDIQHAIRLCLGGTAERRRPKKRHRAQVSGAAKRSFLNHRCSFSVRTGVRGCLLGHAIPPLPCGAEEPWL